MFSKSKINEPIEPEESGRAPAPPPVSASPPSTAPSTAPKTKSAPSILSSDLTVRGNVLTAGDIQVEGTVEGDIRAHLLTVGETATIKGEVVADDVVVNGRVVGRLRGIKVRLTSSARVEGDIIHKTIAIESGAHFEGSVSRAEDPLNTGGSKQPPAKPPVASDEKS
ncbi:MAG: polymer-forming cytoskeletal protein [Pseudomonadota bacterium]